jgi:conjugative transfer region protein TrbK
MRRDPRILARAGAVLVLLAVVVAAVIAFSRQNPVPATSSTDPLVTVNNELERCQALGTAAGDDPACQAAWKQAREHFFGASDGDAR